MFWRDPMLYGATFPYKDLNTPVPTPWTGFGLPAWSNIPRFAPPTHVPQFNLPLMNFPQQFIPPQMNFPQQFIPPQMPFNPYLYPQAINPFMQIPYTPFTPYMAPFLPQGFDVNFGRPFIG